MTSREIDPIRENRIDYEIVVDAYGEAERAMGWYCMYVEVAYIGEEDDTFTAKLSDIEAIKPDPATEEALADWQYWIDMNYGF